MGRGRCRDRGRLGQRDRRLGDEGLRRRVVRQRGGDANADNLAVWDGTGWHAVGGADPNGPVWALTISGDNLIIGGAFDNLNNDAAADDVAAYSLTGGTWSAMLSGSGLLGTVFALTPDGAGGAWVGGYFADANGVSTADYAAHWQGGTTWSSLGGVGLNGTVRGLAASGTGVTLGGDFTNAGGVPEADKVARFDGSWSALGSTSAFGEGGASVYAVALDGPRTIVAGTFLNAAGNARADGVAIFDGASWSNLGTNAAGTNGPGISFRAVAVLGSRAYAGGLDTQIGGGALNVCVAYFRLRQPDGTIQTSGTAAVGNGIYNSTGASQVKSLSVARSGAGTFTIRIQNDGGIPDTIRIKAPGSGGGFTATWKVGTTDISTAVVAGTWSRRIPAHGQVTLTLRVAVGGGVAHGAARSWLLVATSTDDAARKDAVKATVRVR